MVKILAILAALVCAGFPATNSDGTNAVSPNYFIDGRTSLCFAQLGTYGLTNVPCTESVRLLAKRK